MKTTPIFLFSILLLGACGGPAARAKRPGAKAQAAAAVRCLHKAFDLDSDSVFEETQLSAEEIAAKMNKGR